MKEKIKKILPIFLFIIAVIFPLVVGARSGCCSHHGGVCGCGCCDGTPLSATCAPYYPQCNRPVAPIKQEPITPTTPVSPKTETPESKQEIPDSLPVSTYNPNQFTAQASNKTSNSIWWVVLGLGIGGFVAYLFLRRKR